MAKCRGAGALHAHERPRSRTPGVFANAVRGCEDALYGPSRDDLPLLGAGQPVAHLLRLNPRAEGATILERSLTVDPKPIAFREETDRFGNRVTHLDFEGFSDRLRIESRFDLETVAPEPFAGLGAPPLPWAGGPDDPMAQYRSGEAQEPAVRELRRPSLPRAGGRFCSFSTASTGRFSPG